MLKSQELKLFCDKYSLEFPEFIITTSYSGITCTIEWYNNIKIHGKCMNTSELAIISAIGELSIWINSEENFILLLKKI